MPEEKHTYEVVREPEAGEPGFTVRASGRTAAGVRIHFIEAKTGEEVRVIETGVLHENERRTRDERKY